MGGTLRRNSTQEQGCTEHSFIHSSRTGSVLAVASLSHQAGFDVSRGKLPIIGRAKACHRHSSCWATGWQLWCLSELQLSH
jgi:hypothetical protein